jgi:hypothetical protein
LDGLTAYAREAVIVLGVLAAILVSAGTWKRLREKSVASRTATLLISVGYVLFAFSIGIFILAGFLNL